MYGRDVVPRRVVPQAACDASCHVGSSVGGAAVLLTCKVHAQQHIQCVVHACDYDESQGH